MRILSLSINKFKNLVDFKISFDANQSQSVLIGKNATGKSNLFEAIIVVFKYLDLQKKPPSEDCFDYTIEYLLEEALIKIEFIDNRYSFSIAKISKLEDYLHKKHSYVDISNKEFYQNSDIYLPHHVFVYYSGVSNKFEEHFTELKKKYYLDIIKPDFDKTSITGLRRMFNVQTHHSQFVLMAFFSFDKDYRQTSKILKLLGIEKLVRILFIIKEPSWSGSGDSRFFGATGLVSDFLKDVWDCSIVPIYDEVRDKQSYTSLNKRQRVLYLFLSNGAKLKKLASEYEKATILFNAIESTFISELVDEIRVRVKKKAINKALKFSELSEGEQQLLTVFGMLRFTKNRDSLILLDEPETHLNPFWKWQYMEYLNDILKDDDSTQLLINTHDPFIIGSLRKEQVRIFKDHERKISIEEPEIDPRNQSIEKILTSELFNIPSTINKEMEDKINKKRFLQVKLSKGGLSKEEESEYDLLDKELTKYGFYSSSMDSRFNRFVELTSKHKAFQKSPLSDKEIDEIERISKEVAKEILKETK